MGKCEQVGVPSLEASAQRSACRGRTMTVFSAFALLGAAASHHDHLWTVSHPALLTPHHGRRASSVSHSIEADLLGSKVSLSYTATASKEHTLGLLDPELAPLVASIHCNTTHVQLLLQEGSNADPFRYLYQPGAVITGACTEGASTDRHPFYRTAHGITVCEECSPQEVLFETRPARLAAAFDAIDFNFHMIPQAKTSVGTEERSDSHRPVRRRLFLQSVVGGFLNDLGEGLVSVGGALLSAAGNALGIPTGDLSSLFDDVQNVWDALETAYAVIFTGLDFSQTEVADISSINYDPATGGAIEAEIPFFHTPWVKCEGCYFNANVSAELSFSFSPGAVPLSFHAEVGAALDLRAFVTVASPAPAEANDHGNWHVLAERVSLGRFDFTVGQVPVQIDLYGELNGAGWSSEDVPDLSFDAGVEAHAEARFGVDWSPELSWRKVQETDWNTSYWQPTWSAAGPNNATIRASVSPEITMVVWEVVPLEIKPKIIVGAHFGPDAETLPAKPAYLGLPQNKALSKLPQLTHHNTMSATPMAFADTTCDAGDMYAMFSEVRVGIGIEDVKIPQGTIPLVDRELDLVGGVDFGESVLLPEAGRLSRLDTTTYYLLI